MGDKKKHKDKKSKNKKKNKQKHQKQREKEKKEKYSYSSQSQSSSQSSSRSRSRQKRKSSKNKKKQKKQSPNQQIPKIGVIDMIPGATLPGMTVGTNRVLPKPPPVSVVSTTAPVPKSKSKQINIFKLLPKLPYGPVLFARTLYSSDYVSPNLQKSLYKHLCQKLQKVIRTENSKKALSILNKLSSQIQKIQPQQKIEQCQKKQQGENIYDKLEKIYNQAMQSL